MIGTNDARFAEKIGKTIDQWGFRHLLLGSEAESELRDEEGDVALLDIRDLAEDTFAQVRAISERYPGIELVLINKPDNVAASIAGMKAGAADEIMVPVDTGVLQTIVNEACSRRQAGRRQKQKKPLLTRFSEVMMAATFAQAGDFEGALDLLDRPAANKRDKEGSK